MKMVFLGLNILIFNSTIFCQEIISDPHHEIFCGSENYNYQLTYNLEPIGTVWDVYWPNSTTHIFTIDTDGSSNGGLFVAEPNMIIYYWRGYNYIALIPVIPTEDFGFGLYKLSVMNKYIYLDWRDTRYGSYVNCNGGHCADIYIKYDGLNGNIYIKNHANFDWGNAIQNGKYFSIWELKNQGAPLTNDAPSFWTNCLVVIPSQTGNNPRLVWGPYPSVVLLSKHIKFTENMVHQLLLLVQHYQPLHISLQMNLFIYQFPVVKQVQMFSIKLQQFTIQI